MFLSIILLILMWLLLTQLSTVHDIFWENLIKNLIKLWASDFKGMDSGTGEYELEKPVWAAIGEATASSGEFIPSCYGACMPNVADEGVYLMAEMISFWSIYIGPALPQCKFHNCCYYDHFICLIRLLNICPQFEITHEEITELNKGFKSWVQDYEQMYYQHDHERLSLCPLTIHAILHTAPGIKDCSPVWCNWAFPMERYCGIIGPAIRSWQFPFASLAWHVLEQARLAHIKVFYNVVTELSLVTPHLGTICGSYENPAYPTCRLLLPKSPDRPPINTLSLLIGALVTRFDDPTTYGTHVSPGVVKRCLANADLQEWGKVQWIDTDEGDTMRPSEVGKVRDDSRGASYVRYEMYVDIHARQCNIAPKFQLETFYGQLQPIYVVHFGTPCSELNLHESSTTIIMAQIWSCRLNEDESIPGLDIHFYSGEGNTDVIDLTSVQCVVGRASCGQNCWAIIDCSGSLAWAISQVHDEEDNSINEED
ncbi:hypothetical protein K435DRAFT_821627 [Dendrothele bispora CBS 962.96]|uniref:Uncharacterized protein n=1 Tax=Dendrothele bispora (strain CBS 962.96) TaxID=1314807 RepID=A0A4S8LHR2_DENBC|nr:hypothetical protein K435DRAFT_821627 [Dendrothele bispora CBS 962.96]